MQQTDHIQRSPGSGHSDLGLIKDEVVPEAALTFKTQLTVSSMGYRTQDITGVLLQARCYQTVFPVCRYEVLLPLGRASTHSYELMPGDLLYGVLLPS